MAQYEHLPIFKQMLELTVHIEKTVRRFPRYHKYTLGSEIAEANSTRERRALLMELRNTLERLKIHLVLAKEVQAFHKARAFYQVSEMVVAVSRQNEGWLKSMGASTGRRRARETPVTKWEKLPAGAGHGGVKAH